MTKLAELAKEDARYTRMVHHLERGTPLNMIEQDSELRELWGDIQYVRLFYTESGPLIVKVSSIVLIPENGRKTILEELHSTHLPVELGVYKLQVVLFFSPAGIDQGLFFSLLYFLFEHFERILTLCMALKWVNMHIKL